MSSGEARTQTSGRKSFSKRPLVHSDDDDDDDPSITQNTKRARTVDVDVLSSDDDDDMDVDVEALDDSRQRSLSITDESRFLPEDDVPHDQAKEGKKRTKTTAVSASIKKKPRMVYSDEEESHIEHDSTEGNFSDSALPLDDISDHDFELDTAPKRSALKVKAGAVKGKAGKTRLGLKGAQAKDSKDKDKDKDKEILMKDERKLAVPPVTTSRASSAATQSQPSDLFSNDDLALSSTVDAPPDVLQSARDALSQPIPKKRKLPPIKKNKTSTGPMGTSTPSITATQKSAPAPVQELAKPSLPTSEQRKQALTGVRDIDLGDSKVYAELFKGAGGNTPRSGLKNAEERRKELDKMRDDARARRAEETKFTFDLQSQCDKIARFEQRLRTENSTVLHPNFLAAKFRDEWELERRHKRTTSKEEGEA